tara:strand:+ start:1229 stop:2155 length:927 start_codon:yes stop_codon:yes gene_type:complete
MKLKSLLFAGLITLSAPIISQNTVTLHLNHMFNGIVSLQGELYQIQGEDFYYDRIQYYLSDFVLIHDGGVETSLGDLVFLVDSDHGDTYNLGYHESITEIEQIRFSIGVPQNLNHLDPSTYELSHPLAHQNPSMHWGWTAGYRFLCLDAYSGNEIVQIHALGDANFYSQTQEVNSMSDSGIIDIVLDANYEKILTGINVTSGVYEHSETSSTIVAALENMQNLVFTPSVIAVNDPVSDSFAIYPNPTSDIFIVSGVQVNSVAQIFDMKGRLVQSIVVSNSCYVDVSLLNAGVYSILIEGYKAQKLVVS